MQDMDHIEASFVFCVKVGTFDQLEQSKIYILTGTSLGIVMLTVSHDLVVSVCVMQDRRDVFRQISSNIVSIEESHFHNYQTSDFRCLSPQCIPVNKQTTSDQLTANGGMVRNLCNLHI